MRDLGPVHTYPDILESATFSFRIRLPSTRIRRIRQWIQKKKTALQSGKKYIRNESDNVWTGPEWKKNKSATNPITCGRVNPDILLSDDVKSVSNLSPNNKPIWRHNVGGWTEQISRHYLALRRMLWRPFSAEEPWVLEWIRIPSHTCGQGNFWIRKEKVADSKISGYVWTGESG